MRVSTGLGCAQCRRVSVLSPEEKEGVYDLIIWFSGCKDYLGQLNFPHTALRLMHTGGCIVAVFMEFDKLERFQGNANVMNME